MVQRFWKIEAEGTLLGPNEDSSLENLAVQTMGNSICYNDERYQNGPPWELVKKLHKNYFSAVSQPKSLQKLQRIQVSIKSTNTHSVQIWKKNFVQPVEMQATPPDSIWYLPHHPVIDPNKPVKETRVANSASKFRGENSELKSSNLTNLLNNLVEVLLIFREHTVAVRSHIEGMFMQIAVRKENQSTLCFLWMIDNNIRLFLFTRIKFVARCS